MFRPASPPFPLDGTAPLSPPFILPLAYLCRRLLEPHGNPPLGACCVEDDSRTGLYSWATQRILVLPFAGPRVGSLEPDRTTSYHRWPSDPRATEPCWLGTLLLWNCMTLPSYDGTHTRLVTLSFGTVNGICNPNAAPSSGAGVL